MIKRGVIIRKKIYLQMVVVLLAINSCTERYELKLEYQQPRLVVEGLISNIEGIKYNYVKLSKSTFEFVNSLSSYYYLGPAFTADTINSINDALVIILDEEGGRDTLKPAPPSMIQTLYDGEGNFIRDTLVENVFYKTGYYYPTKIKGEPEHTYYLEIQYKGNNYHSSCYMPPAPKIDSMTFEFKKLEPSKLSGYAPIVHFNDPANEKNYYLFDFFDVTSAWGVSILDDKHMEDHVNGLDIFKGQTVDWWMDAYPQPGWMFTIEMHSLTNEGYAFYNSLIETFNNDGGTYRPAPATAPGNISNGALGFFRASAIETVTAKVPEEVPDGVFE